MNPKNTFIPESSSAPACAMQWNPPLLKRGVRGDLSFICPQKSPSIPLYQRGTWAASSIELIGFIRHFGAGRNDGLLEIQK
jgi:hypothetical protein